MMTLCYNLCLIYGMQANAMAFNPAADKVAHKHHLSAEPKYKKVLDQRKHAIRGLWVHNGRYYAQITVEDSTTGIKQVKRVPLEGASTDAQAVAKFQDLLTQRRKRALPVLNRTPKFAEFADQYFDYYKQVKDAKRESTLYTERIAVNHWTEHLGHCPRLNGHPASANFSIQTKLSEFARPQLRKQEARNGVELAGYIRCLAHCAARMSEALHLRWSDVDWKQRQITIGSDGLAKNHKARVVDFNPNLEAQLKEMFARKAPDSEWLFPSPQRGSADRAAKTFRETLLIARNAAGLPKFGFHDCRHFFISMCVMSGSIS